MRKDFTFQSSDGKTPIHAVRWMPDSGRVEAILQIAHGMQEFIDRYDHFAKYLNEHGVMVVGHDHVGHGQSILSKENWGFFELKNGVKILLQDIHHLRVMTQRKYPGVPYFMMGHSMGSFLVRDYIIARGNGLNGVILVGSGYTSPRATLLGIALTSSLAKIYGWHHRSTFLTKLAFRKNNRFNMTGEDPDNNWLTKDRAIVDFFYHNPACNYVFTLGGYHTLFKAFRVCNQQKNVNRVTKNLPVFLVSGDEDFVGEYGKGVHKIAEMFRKAGLADVQVKLYKGDRHEILNELDKDKVFADILAWMRQKAESVCEKDQEPSVKNG